MTTPKETVSAAPIPQGEYPPLPRCWTGSPVTVTWAEDGETTTREVYTADQMHAFAAAALAASEARAEVAEEVGRRMTEHVGHYLQRAEAAEQSLADLLAAGKEWRNAEINMHGDPHDGKRISACNRMIAAKDRLNAAIDALLTKGEGETS